MRTPVAPDLLRRSAVELLKALVLMALLLFAPAGTLAWPHAWAFLGAFGLATLIATAVLARVNPEIFAARSRVQPGTKRLDYLFIGIVLVGFLLIFPAAGLAFRFGAAPIPDGLVWLGFGLFALSFAGQAWPQAVNRHFEPGVRIQSERGHAVVEAGPYAVVRHPGYVAGAALAISAALCLGSWWALAPALVVVAGLIARTLFEERVLIAELPGYRDYSRRVRFRWIPGVW